MGADFATFASSPGTHKVNDYSVEFSTGNNTAGYVAAWTDIAPGADGTIVVRTSHTVGQDNGGIPGAHAYKGYAGGIFLVKEQADTPFRWQAFNDSAYKPGQVEAPYATTYGIGRNYVGDGLSGELKKIDSGEIAGVTATFTEFITQGSVNNAGDTASYVPGSDAEAVFGGQVDLAGNVSYGDAPGWHVDLTFTGLDPLKRYTFAGTADRHGGSGYADRVTNWKLIGADSFLYASSTGAHKVNDDSVEFSTGDNTAGLIARWTDINPGPNGAIVIRTSHSVGQQNGGTPGAHAYKGYAGGVFMLGEQIRSSSSGSKPLEIVSLTPADNTLSAHPNTPIIVVIKNGDQKIKTESIRLVLDGHPTTPAVTTSADVTTVYLASTGTLPPASLHTVHVSFTDSALSPNAYAKDWTFGVLDYSSFQVLSESPVQPFDPAKYLTRGFAMTIIAPDPNDFVIGSIDDAQTLLDQPTSSNLIDTSILNSLGYYIETSTINYQINGRPIGNKANDRLFPGISGSGTPESTFAFQARALLRLKAGYYHVNITMQPGFRLFVGDPGNEEEILATFTPCTNCGGDDGPWYMDFVVTRDGLYPFRLLFYNRAGNASLEWLSISPTDSRNLINDLEPEAIEAYVPLDTIPVPPRLTASRGNGQLVISWINGGVLQQADAVTGPWSSVPNLPASPYTVSTAGARKFYRVVIP